ncbi:hypothetical protein KCU92_g73, partial [Aureobasidium melanogenum]
MNVGRALPKFTSIHYWAVWSTDMLLSHVGYRFKSRSCRITSTAATRWIMAPENWSSREDHTVDRRRSASAI